MRRDQVEAGAVGAWVIKCDPDEIFDLGHPASILWDTRRRRPVSEVAGSWSLGPTYRAAIISPGDRCFFWVSGDVDTWESGLWAECDILAGATDGFGGGPWIDQTKKGTEVPYLPVRWRFLSRPIPKPVVRHDPRLKASELVRVPNMTNPVALTAAEAAVLDGFIQRRSRVSARGGSG